MGNKFILWVICSFFDYLKEKFLSNIKAKTIRGALMDTWIYHMGIPSAEFSNISMCKLISKLGFLKI